jgi:hypothetical protein
VRKRAGEREGWRRRRGEDGYTARLVRDRRGAARKVDREAGQGNSGKGGGVDFTLKQTAQRKLRSIHSTRSFHGEISSVK